ncbi:MAG TPA: CAP domain-containing protein [Thermoanaerobaculia bacterium]|nr:CAP domain-containing protein [Thermoanaerobaculia bacterium]
MKKLTVVLALFALALASPGAQSSGAVEETKATLRGHVLTLINRDRALYNLPPVQLDVQASAIGDEYCREQIRNRTTGHFTTDGYAPYMRYSLAGGNHGVSENAAAWSANYTFSDRALYEMARRSQDAMMAEAAPNDGHKRTILDPHATHVGIGLAWEKGEFRLVHEFVRRYVDWSHALPRATRADERVAATGRALPGAKIEAVTVHYERNPETMPAHVASAIDSYSLPDKRREIHPSRRGDLRVLSDGKFSLDVPFTEGPGIYTVVLWVSREGVKQPVAASNVSIRVEGALQSYSRASAAGR